MKGKISMCPNYQVLSAFVDGELSDSQQTKVIEHTERCSACRERLASFRSIKAYLQKAGTVSWPGPKEKVWERLTLSLKDIKQKQEKRFFFWQKQVMLPLPLLVLGGVSFFFVLGFFIFTSLLRSGPAGQSPPDSAVHTRSLKVPVSHTDVQLTVPVQAGFGQADQDVKQFVETMQNGKRQREWALPLPEKLDFIGGKAAVLIPVHQYMNLNPPGYYTLPDFRN